MTSSESGELLAVAIKPGVQRGVVRLVEIAPEDQTVAPLGIRACNREHTVNLLVRMLHVGRASS